jgi:GntR family transcriptional regulator
MAFIDRDSPLPYYFQLKLILLEKIRTNEWSPGSLIPSEHELEAQYEVSRTTIRQALSALVSEGYLVRKRGRGTFVTKQDVVPDDTPPIDLEEYNPERDGPMEWRVIDMQRVKAPAEVRKALTMKRGEPVVRLRRLRLSGSDVLGYYITYIPPAVAVYIDEQNLAVGEPLFYLRKHPLIKGIRMERIVAATGAEQHDLEYLDVKLDSPVLYLERLVVAEEGIPLEYMVGRFRGDRYKYRLTDT